MSHYDYRALVNMGRKAGLNTAELYRALSARPPEANDQARGQTDCNGFASGFSEDGKVEYRPTNPRE